MTHVDAVRKFWSDWRFTVLLSALVILNMARMATVSLVLDRFLLDVFGAAFLMVATLSLCAEKHTRTIALLLGIPATMLSLVGILQSGHEESFVLLAGRSASMLFLGFTIVMILRTLMTQPSVTRDSIAGAFCGYVLIGVAFAEAYCILDVTAPNSFHIEHSASVWQDIPVSRWLTLEYFSFTTLTTLGFGDVLPISPLARGLAVWEAICGQFYLAVLVAGLVNLRATRIADPK